MMETYAEYVKLKGKNAKLGKLRELFASEWKWMEVERGNQDFISEFQSLTTQVSAHELLAYATDIFRSLQYDWQMGKREARELLFAYRQKEALFLMGYIFQQNGEDQIVKILYDIVKTTYPCAAITDASKDGYENNLNRKSYFNFKGNINIDITEYSEVSDWEAVHEGDITPMDLELRNYSFSTNDYYVEDFSVTVNTMRKAIDCILAGITQSKKIPAAEKAKFCARVASQGNDSWDRIANVQLKAVVCELFIEYASGRDFVLKESGGKICVADRRGQARLLFDYRQNMADRYQLKSIVMVNRPTEEEANLVVNLMRKLGFPPKGLDEHVKSAMLAAEEREARIEDGYVLANQLLLWSRNQAHQGPSVLEFSLTRYLEPKYSCNGSFRIAMP